MFKHQLIAAAILTTGLLPSVLGSADTQSPYSAVAKLSQATKATGGMSGYPAMDPDRIAAAIRYISTGKPESAAHATKAKALDGKNVPKVVDFGSSANGQSGPSSQ